MKQSTAWVVSFFASGAICGGLLVILFAVAEGDNSLSSRNTPGAAQSGETLAPTEAPLTLSPDDH